MSAKTRIHFQFDNKIQFIKAIKAVTGLGLKEAKDASEQGWIDVDPEDANKVATALRVTTTHLSYYPPLEMRHVLKRLEAVSVRLCTRAVYALVIGLERVEAALGGVK